MALVASLSNRRCLHSVVLQAALVSRSLLHRPLHSAHSLLWEACPSKSTGKNSLMHTMCQSKLSSLIPSRCLGSRPSHSRPISKSDSACWQPQPGTAMCSSSMSNTTIWEVKTLLPPRLSSSSSRAQDAQCSACAGSLTRLVSYLPVLTTRSKSSTYKPNRLRQLDSMPHPSRTSVAS